MEVVILIEKKGKGQFAEFIKLFIKRSEISTREIRQKIPKSSFYNIILGKLYDINESIKKINPELESFISPTINQNKGRITQCFKKSDDIELIDEDPNFFKLKLEGRDYS